MFIFVSYWGFSSKSAQFGALPTSFTASWVAKLFVSMVVHCWNKMCLTLPLESFDDNKVLKIVNWIC